MNLKALTVNLEGVLRDRRDGTIVDAVAIGEPVAVKMPMPKAPPKGEFSAATFTALWGSNRYQEFEAAYRTGSIALPGHLKGDEAYVVGLPGNVGSSAKSEYYILPVQFYRVK